MNAQLFGRVRRPAAVAVSTWDPLLPVSRGFLQQLVEYARTHDQTAVAVVLDPAPQRYLRGAANWPVYVSLPARLHCLLAAGLDGVLHIDFQEQDLKLGVYELLDSVRTRIEIAEIWMRPQQTFGPDERGSLMALAIYAKKHRFVWKRPDVPETKALTTAVQQHLRHGEVAAARSLVGAAPIWSRPESTDFESAWCPGRYVVRPGLAADSADRPGAIVVELHENGDGLAYMRWPLKEIEHLTVLGGPADVVAHEPRRARLAGERRMTV